MMHGSCEQSLKIEQDFEVAELCKFYDFWHDASKLLTFYMPKVGSERPLEVREIWLNSEGTRP